MRFGLFGINIGAVREPADGGARRAGRGGGRLRVGVDGRARRAARSAGAAVADAAARRRSSIRPSRSHSSRRTRQRIRLGTGIIILPQRNPLVLAKELASVDVVSGGRLIFGLGIGYLKPEFDALGIPFDHKGARAIEYLEAMLAVWTAPQPAYDGRFVSFRGIQALPRPVQQPHPPIVIGGQHAGGVPPRGRARQRLVRLRARPRRRRPSASPGCAARSPSTRGRRRSARSRSASRRAARSTSTPVERFAELGVHRLIPFWPLPSTEALIERVRRFGDEVIAHG